MAYVPSQLDAEGDEQKRLNISGSGASTGTAAGTGAGNQPIAPSGSSGSFTNIRDYLGANQAGAAGLGQTVSGKINKEAGEAESAISSGETGVRGKITAGTNAYDQTSLDQTISTGQAHDTTRRNLTGTYAGPTSLAEYRPNIDRELTEAKDVAGLAGTAGGRVELLRTLTGRPQTTGVTRLNSALLQGNEQARGMVAGAVQRVNPLTGRLETAEQATARAAEEAAATNRAVRERTVGGLNTYLTGQETEADARLVELRNRETARAQAARDYLTRLGAVGQRAPLEEGRAQAGGSGGLVNTDTLAGRVSALSAPTEQRAQIASVPVTAPRATIAAAPTEGRATIQRVASRYYADGGDGGAYRGDGGGFVGPATPVTMVPGGAVPTSEAVPAVGGGVVSANPPSYIAPVGPVPVEQLELVSGFEQAGLTEAQARELQNSVAQNAREGGVRVDLTQYYTPAQIDGLTRAAVITPEQAARYTALANLAGREGSYQSMAPDLNGATNIAGARSAISSKYEAARQWNAERAAAATAEANRVAEANRLAAEAQAARDAAAAAQAARDAAARQAAIDAQNQYNYGGGGGENSGPGDSGGDSGPGDAGGDGSVGGDGSTGSSTGGNSGVGNSAEGEGNTGPGGESGAGGGDSNGGGDGSTGGDGSDGSSSGGNSGVGNSAEGEGSTGPGGESGAGGGDSSSSGDSGSAGVGDAPGSVGSAGGEGPSGDSAGGGGGGGGGGCVMATALTAKGGWEPTQKNALIDWCEKTLHGTRLGETIRRGYQVIGSKIGVPFIWAGGWRERYARYTFETITNVLRKKPVPVLAALNGAMWFTAVMAVGAVVSKEYAKRTWNSLYKPKDNE